MTPNPLTLGKALRKRGLSLGHLLVLCAIWKRGALVPSQRGLTYNDLIDLTGDHPTTIRNCVNNLEAIGIVQQVKGRRGGYPPVASRFWLTEEGANLMLDHCPQTATA